MPSFGLIEKQYGAFSYLLSCTTAEWPKKTIIVFPCKFCSAGWHHSNYSLKVNALWIEMFFTWKLIDDLTWFRSNSFKKYQTVPSFYLSILFVCPLKKNHPCLFWYTTCVPTYFHFIYRVVSSISPCKRSWPIPRTFGPPDIWTSWHLVPHCTYGPLDSWFPGHFVAQ